MDKIKIFIGIVAVILAGTFYLWVQREDVEQQEVVTESFHDVKEEQPEITEHGQAGKIYVHICGAVKKPGVYTFQQEPRVIEVVKKAGGFTSKANHSSLNLAQVLTDGMQIRIPKKMNKSSKVKSTSDYEKQEGAASDSSKINLNTATKEQLMTLNGIGESKANMILSYREEKGRFQSTEEIMQVSGIKDGVFRAIKDYIVV